MPAAFLASAMSPPDRRRYTRAQYDGFAKKQAEKAFRNTPFLLSSEARKRMTADFKKAGRRRKSLGLPPIGAPKRLGDIESIDGGARVRQTAPGSNGLFSARRTNNRITSGAMSITGGSSLLSRNEPRRRR